MIVYMRKLLIILFFLICQMGFAQTYLKINGITALALVPNIGFETKIAERFTFQTDVTASFWKSVNGAPLKFLIVTPEIRYHFNETFNGFYAGFHIGGATFNIQRWDYQLLNYNQKGYSYFIGSTIGYQKKLSEKFLLDFFIGGGSIQSFYKGYDLNTGLRYETADRFNKSGEFLPYRGGIMICYKLN